MVERIDKASRRCGLAAVVMAALIAGGCGPQSATMPTYMQPELLYLKDQPYTRLYVEVDVMEGLDVPQEWLDELEAFLAGHCDKPDGITVVRDEPVPPSAMVGLPIELVGMTCLDGPPEEVGQPAYLHVVFYDSRKWRRQQSRPPFVRGVCPSEILCDVDYGFRQLKDRLAGAALRHEAGHVLGLCKNREHGDGAHCRNYGCIMERSPDIGSQLGLLVGAPLDNKLCDDCKRDLESSRSQAVPDNLSFVGPFLVRRENEYDVLRLPGYDMLVAGATGEPYPWQAILARAQRRITEAASAGAFDRPGRRKRFGPMLTCYDAMGTVGAKPGTDQFKAILSKAARDPCPLVRKGARQHLEERKP